VDREINQEDGCLKSVDRKDLTAISKVWSIVVVVVLGIVRANSLIPSPISESAGLPVQLAMDNVSKVTIEREQAVLRGSSQTLYLNTTTASDSRRAFFAWDKDASVYVTVGRDRRPGVAGVDDDGNGIDDDRSELGATGSDDTVLTPDDDGYVEAVNGSVLAVLLSRGAMRKVVGDAVIEGPGQVRIDLIDERNRMTSRIVDLVDPLVGNTNNR
jgi:hypothetical protein